MTVTHRMAVRNFQQMLEVGGSHRFAITPDELPLLKGIERVQSLQVEVPNELDTTWARLARTIMSLGGACWYTRERHDLCEVTCVLPSRAMQSAESA
jgi:hypothetical protein